MTLQSLWINMFSVLFIFISSPEARVVWLVTHEVQDIWIVNVGLLVFPDKVNCLPMAVSRSRFLTYLLHSWPHIVSILYCKWGSKFYFHLCMSYWFYCYTVTSLQIPGVLVEHLCPPFLSHLWSSVTTDGSHESVSHHLGWSKMSNYAC